MAVILAYSLEMFMILPFAAFTSGKKMLLMRKVESMFTSIMRSRVSYGSSTKEPRMTIPAKFVITSTWSVFDET